MLAMLAVSAWLFLSGPTSLSAEGVVETTSKAQVAGAKTSSAPPRPAATLPSTPSPAMTFVAVLANRARDVLQDAAVERPMLADPFAMRDWAPAVRPVATAGPAPAPVAPPVPLVYLGKQRIDGRWQVFLSQGEQTVIVQEGQSIDNGTYRVESIKPPLLVLQFLPMAQEQMIGIGGED
jgi:hypothetical protein